MSAMTAHEALRDDCQKAGMLLKPPAANQLFVRVTEDEKLQKLSRRLREQGFYLVTLAGTDEYELVDNCFKLTYLFSHPSQDLFLFVEYPLRGSSSSDVDVAEGASLSDTESTEYATLYSEFKAVDPFEHELADMLGVYPYQNGQPQRVTSGSWLHEDYPPDLTPLRRDRSTAELQAAIEQHRCQERAVDVPRPPDGEWWLPVGPIHAGVIEPGRFLFRLGGEVVEELVIRLGYVHKGIERLFQTKHSLEAGWRLAERVSGDSAFAHSLAYCHAAEVLAEVSPPREAELLRGLFLELERMANHIGDCGALAHDVAYDVAASELTALRERLLRLCEQVAGHRLLRGLNRPGGISLPRPLNTAEVRDTVSEIREQFGELAGYLTQMPAFRDRMQTTGILTWRQALDLGATGLVARASGVRRDFRLQHPTGVYQRDQAARELVEQGLPPDDDSIAAREATAGDSLARFLIRKREVASSARIIEYILAQSELDTEETEFVTPVEFRPGRNFGFGLGYVEGWRGDIVYWLMQDKFGRIYRCKVRDPSMLNWPALKAAVDPHELDDAYMRRYRPADRRAEIIVPDFPLVNKSFNLSYSGNDL